MKVGVITFHSAHNYGASLQTWALQKALKKMGQDPCVINYHPEVIDHLYRVPKLKTWAKRMECLKSPQVREKRNKRKIKYKKYTAFLKENLSLVGDFKTYEKLKKAQFGLNAVITGSDQVWNAEHSGGFDPAYTLNFVPAGMKKIAYAASIGSEKFPEEYKKDYLDALSSFDAISVREATAANAVKEGYSGKVEVVLDPTLLLEREEYEEIKIPTERKERYILVYMMETNKEVIILANRLSKMLGLPIIQRRIDPVFVNELESFYTDTPGEFLGEIEGAEYVITNSFHGTVFSLIYEKPFITFTHSTTGSRMEDLLKSLQMEDHLFYKSGDFTSLEEFQIRDKEALRTRIGEYRKSSLEFLKKALQ